MPVCAAPQRRSIRNTTEPVAVQESLQREQTGPDDVSLAGGASGASGRDLTDSKRPTGHLAADRAILPLYPGARGAYSARGA